MDRGDYYEAKAALLNEQNVQMRAAALVDNARRAREAVMTRLGIQASERGYQWDDTTRVITPIGSTGEG